ncbi:MAG: hypothetical protein A3J07_04295 [Candidatus Doudnabacteria bacterium RIFCSPLOWO2_02_FULL_49_13]|uniref:Phosphatidate cytidylyltransferase n=1 Tax=Candidatus Doudnabacteria bacterium RIFCSPHIGHO2_12_FULL_48_16 TaxID=1817838 RepID=A0A1F5PJL3_9BACT|nr:MAG: hypothetical protein A3B77_03100 [Candidatus Doudnabacteria bacterium RIFCSPHIGHO2_02_FULL_49_24]OGE89137.1 MAG: hypothetical protein A2760_04205 [Candidatus Doudnabacteria bacterium RIFCSPHIGHO2_01_FULL_50_67]OGE90133.1 MAG: hypothetical protein A3E29_03435 [Candidatus Doudnabacteria bacterium RIFCSPHIGHO2_12_FULL_48_16]OGF03276.1 MAG: hypothetical protein A3J07_04295 [Candidatus Doudnabacteria bacterium RIFCSPLOWO2_02_FULL_49_13]OGF03822.1 MAG: hypothetical protein A3H14_04135 [Candid
MKQVLVRKFGHLAASAAFFAFPYFFSPKTMIGLCGLFAILLLLGHLIGLSRHHRVDRITLGEFYFPLGVALSAFFFLPQNLLAFQFGILILGVSDTAAELTGRLWGRHQIKSVHKTWEGVLAFFLVSLLIFLLFVWPQHPGTILAGLSITLLLTLLEGLLSFGLDNLFLPIIAAVLLNWLIK